MNKRIAIITRFFPPASIGGTEKHVMHLSSGLARLGYDVEVLAPEPMGSFKLADIELEPVNGFEVHRFPIYSFGLFEFSPGMQEFLKHNQFDLVHFHTRGILCYLLRKKIRVPYVITTHGFCWTSPPPWNIPGYIYTYGILKPNFAGASQIICVGEMDKRSVIRMLGSNQASKVKYIPNGVDLQTFKFNKKGRLELKRQKGIESKVVVSCVATFTKRKRQDLLVRSIKGLSDNILKRSIFILAGFTLDNRYFNYLKNLIKTSNLQDKIILKPNPSDKEIKEIFCISDIFVLPSDLEGLPLTLLEAWASGLAPMLSSVGGIPYVVRDGINGLLVNPGDPFDLSRKLTMLILNEDMRNKISKAGLEKVRKHFSWDMMVRKVSDCYDSVLSCSKK